MMIARLACLILAFTCSQRGTTADGPNITDLQFIYEKSSPGQMPCYYDGSLCKRREEFCSNRSRTCEPLFGYKDSTEEKVAYCNKLIKDTSAELGMRDTCKYFFGELAIKQGCDFIVDKGAQASQTRLTTGKEFCPAANESCQLGNEICNSTSGKCDKLFPTGTTDDEKRRKCHEVVKSNITERYDACMYVLGTLYHPKRDVGCDRSPSDWEIAATAFAVFLVLVLAAVAVTLIMKCKNYWCFRKTDTPEPKSDAGKPDPDAINKKVATNLGKQDNTKEKKPFLQ